MFSPFCAGRPHPDPLHLPVQRDAGRRDGLLHRARPLGPAKSRPRCPLVTGKKINRTHTHTHRQRTTPPTPTHTHTRQEQRPIHRARPLGPAKGRPRRPLVTGAQCSCMCDLFLLLPTGVQGLSAAWYLIEYSYSSAFTRYSFCSRPVYKNQSYYSQTPPLFGHLPPSSSPTLLRNIVSPPDHPLLQYAIQAFFTEPGLSVQPKAGRAVLGHRCARAYMYT